MLRSVLGIFVGWLVGSLAALVVQLLTVVLLSATAFVAVALAWMVAPLVATFVAALIVRRQLVGHAVMLGLIFVAMDAINLWSIPSPWWLNAVGILLPIPLAIVGALIAGRFLPAEQQGPQRYDMRERNMAC